jgi:hypothetical protein
LVAEANEKKKKKMNVTYIFYSSCFSEWNWRCWVSRFSQGTCSLISRAGTQLSIEFLVFFPRYCFSSISWKEEPSWRASCCVWWAEECDKNPPNKPKI